jgi:hypothetical protein
VQLSQVEQDGQGSGYDAEGNSQGATLSSLADVDDEIERPSVGAILGEHGAHGLDRVQYGDVHLKDGDRSE